MFDEKSRRWREQESFIIRINATIYWWHSNLPYFLNKNISSYPIGSMVLVLITYIYHTIFTKVNMPVPWIPWVIVQRQTSEVRMVPEFRGAEEISLKKDAPNRNNKALISLWYLFIISIFVNIYIYIYLEPVNVLYILGLEPSKRRPFPFKTMVIWVPNII